MGRPNILLITTDQQRYDTISALGNGSIFTPHLNWLVREGITYENCYSACPICMPARATIMTGLESHRHGLTGNLHSQADIGVTEQIPGKCSRDSQLSEKLLPGRKPHGTPAYYFYVIIHQTYQSETYRKKQNRRYLWVIFHKCHGCGQYACQYQNPAHSGSARLFQMGGRPVVPDGLTAFQPPQKRDQDRSGKSADTESKHDCRYAGFTHPPFLSIFVP